MSKASTSNLTRSQFELIEPLLLEASLGDAREAFVCGLSSMPSSIWWLKGLSAQPSLSLKVYTVAG